MDESVGRREQHKRATRAALREAAVRLFRQRGYQATTVREIAAAAGVTERTFYRYFDGKDDLLADEARAWIERLQDAIRQRPQREPPLTALRAALLSLAKDLAVEGGPLGPGPLLDGPRPFALLRQATARPLLSFENAIASALLERASRDQTSSRSTRAEFEAQVYARVAVAALRSAVIRHRQLEHDGNHSPGMPRLLAQAFDAIGRSEVRR